MVQNVLQNRLPTHLYFIQPTLNRASSMAVGELGLEEVLTEWIVLVVVLWSSSKFHHTNNTQQSPPPNPYVTQLPYRLHYKCRTGEGRGERVCK